MKLPLDSPRWHELSGNYRLGDHRVLKTLPTFLSTEADEEAKLDALDEIFDAIHHQGDVYEVTFVTVPWLVEQLENHSQKTQFFIVGVLANIASHGDVDVMRSWFGALKPEEVNEYHRTIDFCRGFAFNTLMHTLPTDSDWVVPFVSYYASFSGLRQPYWYMSNQSEFWLECENCKAGLDFDIDLAKRDAKYQLSRESKEAEIHPRDSFPSESFSSRVMNVMSGGRHPEHYKLYQHCFGLADCPSCGQKVDLLTILGGREPLIVDEP